MSDRLHIVSIGAHCCCTEIMAGATVAKYIRHGHKGTLVHMTLGEKGHKGITIDEYAAQKREEALRCGAVIGADVRFMPWKDAELPFDDEVAFHLADVLREIKPDIVITHWKGSFHSDHVNTHHNVRRAAFLASWPHVRRELPAYPIRRVYFAENWEDLEGFRDDVYIDVSETVEQWEEAMNAYELFRGGVSGFRYANYYKGLKMMRGALGGFDRAEAFMEPSLERPGKRQAFDLG